MKKKPRYQRRPEAGIPVLVGRTVPNPDDPENHQLIFVWCPYGLHHHCHGIRADMPSLGD